MSKIEINNVYKIFGSNPKSILPMVKDGASKEEILDKTGHTVGLDNVSLKIEEGETFVCMGLSGSGKSTLIRHLNRLIDPTDGEIIVEGTNVMNLNKQQLIEFRRHKMSMVFQRFGLFPHRTVMDNVTLKIEEGEIFVCMGLSGSGKSTLIRHLNRLIDPTDGEIIVEGTNVMSLNKQQLIEFRRHKMSMVFQRFGLFPHRTVIDNVGYGLEMQGVAVEERKKTAMKKIESVGLSGFENQYPAQLSGGMQQRVGLARALANDTDIMLMDEAFSALDPLIRSDMQKQLIDLQSELKKTIVFITHDLDESLRLGDHIGILNHGKLVQVGTPFDIIMNPADDYVKAFVKDVNRTKVIKAKTIMISEENVNGVDKNNIIKVKEDQFIEEFLPQVVGTNTSCEVVDKSGNIKGYITKKELQKTLTKS